MKIDEARGGNNQRWIHDKDLEGGGL